MLKKLDKILQAQGWALADGATGTNLFKAGLEAGEAPELWNETHPQQIEHLYRRAIEAGCDIFLTNSFGGNALRLCLHNAHDRCYALNKMAAEIARKVADSYTRPIIVAGSMGPTGELMQPVGTLSHDTAVAIFAEQAQGLIDGGVDILWLETISAIEEYTAAAEAIKGTNMPWVGTMSFDSSGRTMMGVTTIDMVTMIKKFQNTPIAFGANCGVGAADLLRTIIGLSKQKPTVPLVAKGNAGIPKYIDGHIYYDGTPYLMARYAVLARNCGATIIGGCCGTTAKHLQKMRQALEQTPKTSCPTLTEIEATLGAFSSVSDGSDGKPVRKKSRRRSQ